MRSIHNGRMDSMAERIKRWLHADSEELEAEKRARATRSTTLSPKAAACSCWR
jgi:hypothetical protein